MLLQSIKDHYSCSYASLWDTQISVCLLLAILINFFPHKIVQTACSILKKNGLAVITDPPGALIAALKPLEVDGAGKLPAIKKGRQIFGVLSSLKNWHCLEVFVNMFSICHRSFYLFIIANVGLPKEAQTSQHRPKQP